MSDSRDAAGRSAGPDPDWERDFRRLRETYRGRLRQQLDELEGLLGEVREGAPLHAKLEAARRLAHRLKGTSGTYEFDESSAALERLEEALARLPDAAGSPVESAWAEIERALQRARAGLA